MIKLEALVLYDYRIGSTYLAVWSHLLFQISTAMTVTMSTKAANAPHTAYKAVLLSDVHVTSLISSQSYHLPSQAFLNLLRLAPHSCLKLCPYVTGLCHFFLQYPSWSEKQN